MNVSTSPGIAKVAFGGFGRAEHGPGDPYKRIVDHSEAPAVPTYYKLAK